MEKETYQKITINYKIFKVNILDYDFRNIKLGDIIKVTGSLRQIESNHLPNGFDYQSYFYNNLFLYELKVIDLEVVDKEFSILSFHEYIKDYLSMFFKDEALIILKAFIIGDTSDFSLSFQNSLKVNGIVHLFAISGLHVALIINIFEKILKKIKYKNIIINTFLIFYLIVTKFTVSISRAVFTYLFRNLLISKNIKITSLDITSIIYIVFLIYNPYYIYNNGFVLSFFATFIIILVSDIFRKYNKYITMLLITVMINLFTLPIIINMNHEYNLLNPVINLIMVLLVEMIILPISLFVAVFPVFNIGYTYLISAFIYLNEIISEISKKLRLVIVLSHKSNFLILLYYLLLLIFFLLKTNKLKKWFIMAVCFLVIVYKPFYKDPTITFLDLYNGESTLIRYKNETILIDTGEGINNEVSNYLKSEGIYKINYLIITHNHSDHTGEMEYILDNFVVTNIVVSEYDNNVFDKNASIIILEKGQTLNTKYFKFDCLAPSNKNINENNNSLVLYTNIKGIGVLFTGDIEKEIEDELISLDIDILKVAHHGSTTSTSIEFIKKTKPEYAVIMSGRSNIFSFPSNEILERLINNNITVYCTKYNYTITLKIKNKKCIFSTMKEIIK